MAFAQPKCLFPSLLTAAPRRRDEKRFCSASAKPRRVGIAGAGIAGLATALALQRTPATGVEHIEIFEPRLDADVGQGAALNLNGASAILGKVFGLPMHDIGAPIDRVIAREVTGSTLFDVNVEQLVKTSAQATRELCINGRHSFMAVMREELQAVLIKQIEERVTFHRGECKRVRGVHQEGSKAHFVLKDGTLSAPFDLLVGADGVRSSVRTHVCGQATAPIYGGIRIQWAVAGGCTLPRGHLEQWFGDGAYVVRYAARSKRQTFEMMACSFRQQQSGRENEEYEQDRLLRDDFLARLQRSGMPAGVMDVLQRSERVIETAVYRQPVPAVWHRGPCCLVGDSAHAMPPYLGQGANQAVQDAYCLAAAISGIGAQYGSLAEALQRYERIRRAPVEAILQTSRLVSLLEIQDGPLASRVRNSVFRLLGAAGVPGATLVQAALPRVS